MIKHEALVARVSLLETPFIDGAVKASLSASGPLPNSVDEGSDDAVFRVAQKVNITGIASKPFLNDTEGMILGKSSDRWQVFSLQSQAAMLLRGRNLTDSRLKSDWLVCCSQCDNDFCDAVNNDGACLRCPFHPQNAGYSNVYKDDPLDVAACKDLGSINNNPSAASSSWMPSSSMSGTSEDPLHNSNVSKFR